MPVAAALACAAPCSPRCRRRRARSTRSARTSRAFIAEMARAARLRRRRSSTRLFAQVESRPAIIEAMTRPAEKAHALARVPRALPHRRGASRAASRRSPARRPRRSSRRSRQRRAGRDACSPSSASRPSTARSPASTASSTRSRRSAFDYPPRSQFFRGELEQFLLMTREESLDPLEPLGSYAGAMGIPQFMPTSFRATRSTATATATATCGAAGATCSRASRNYLQGARLAHRRARDGPAPTSPAPTSPASSSASSTLTETVGSLRDARRASSRPTCPTTRRRC